MPVIIKRSPSYPRVSLDRAIELTGKVYTSAYQSDVDTETVLHLMGFEGKSGPSTAALSSLKQYGLIEGRDQALRVTPLALQILHPKTQAEKLEALRDAARAPQFYEEIRKQFGGKLPGDQVLKSYLVRNHSFNPNGAEFFLRILKHNRAYMDESETGLDGSVAVETPQPMTELRPAISNARTEDEEGAESEKDIFRFRVAPNCIARIIFTGPVTKSAIEKTIQYLELAKDNYPDGSI